MNESIYRHDNLIIFNFSQRYFTEVQQILNSKEFITFVYSYLVELKNKRPEYYNYLVKNDHPEVVAMELVRVLRMLLIFKLHEIEHYLLNDLEVFDEIIEEMYDYWRKLQRFSLMYAGSDKDIQVSNFIENDNKFNNLVIGMYRSFLERIRGCKSRVYRQLQAGTNASIVLRDYDINLPDRYKALKQIPFIDSLMLRTPLILFPKSNKRVGTFDNTEVNPIDKFKFDSDQWMIYPAKIGKLLAYIYFHRDYLPSVVALSNLFELANDVDCLSKKPDIILLFGNKDGLDTCLFHEDLENDIVIGSVSYGERIDYFGYLKKMALTLHNVKMIRKGYLPIHGAMVNVTFKNGLKKGVVLIGDSGAGKSESIEALQNIANDKIQRLETIYDDMGIMFVKDGKVVSSGTEIGAFIRLDDLEKGSAYRDMDRSIFFNPQLHNARVVTPVNTYANVASDHQVDMVLYANNYTNKKGVTRFDCYQKAQETFISGKRMALGTTHESGITETYFANPFGPAQRQDICGDLFRSVYLQLFTNNIFVGEIYTHLGLSESKDLLLEGAKELLSLMEKK